MNTTLLLSLLLLAVTPPEAPAVAATVHIKNFAYQPPAVTIDAGQSVLFINDDEEAHTVSASDHSFDSKGLDTGQQWRHTFLKPGTYSYFCEIHPMMKATIVVKAGSK